MIVTEDKAQELINAGVFVGFIHSGLAKTNREMWEFIQTNTTAFVVQDKLPQLED